MRSEGHGSGEEPFDSPSTGLRTRLRMQDKLRRSYYVLQRDFEVV